MKRKHLVLAAAAIGLFAVGCNSSSKQKISGGIEYTIDEKGSGEKFQLNDTILVHFSSYYNGDSLLADSKSQRGGEPITLVLTQSVDPSDLMDGLVKLRGGDSATFTVPVDSMKNPPFFAKPGDFLKICFRAVGKFSTSNLLAEENNQIDSYLKENNLTATKTTKGVYIVTKQEGTGETPHQGDLISVNYTGKLLDGTVFDSNTDSTIRPGMPLEPLKFPVGVGQVIAGWDEALLTLKKGSVVTLFIPSGLAYGPNGAPPVIKPNSILVFDVEILGIEGNPNSGSHDGHNH
jgi:FKBP-type peptidyl-prolyl cis-trans isomerase FkpA